MQINRKKGRPWCRREIGGFILRLILVVFYAIFPVFECLFFVSRNGAKEGHNWGG